MSRAWRCRRRGRRGLAAGGLLSGGERFRATALEAYRGALVVVSHDTAFLDDIGVERIVDLTPDE